MSPFPLVMMMKPFEQIITSDTKLKIWFDSSGSMNSTLTPLTTMKNTILKDMLLPFYNNDGDLYDSMVTITNWSNERTFSITGVGDFDENKIIDLVFQDEANSIYHGSSFNSGTRTSQYNTDITDYRNRIQGVGNNKHRAVIFQVVGFTAFKQFLQAVQNGANAYAVPYGLSDKGTQILYTYDVTGGASAQYYADLIIDTLGIIF